MAGFKVVSGKIQTPSGANWIGCGVDVHDGNLGAAASAVAGQLAAPQVASAFPGINLIRVASGNQYHGAYPAPSSFASAVTTFANLGIVLEFTNYGNNSSNGGGGGNAGTIFTGQALTDESNWYAAMATYYINNPYVWFGTNNEPAEQYPDGNYYQTGANSLAAWQYATHQAIRVTAGSNAPLLIEPAGNTPPGNQWRGGSGGAGATLMFYTDPAYIAQMTNVIWDPHIYSYQNNGVTSRSGNNGTDALVAAVVAACQAVHSADGVMPVIVGEFGCISYGQTSDPYVASILANGVSYCAWAWDAQAAVNPSSVFSDPNAAADQIMLTTNGVVGYTPYGAQMKAGILATSKLQGAPAGSLAIVTPGTQNANAGFVVSGTISGYTSAPTLNYSDSTVVTVANYITPGVGSFTDASGNVYTLTAAGIATEAVGGTNPQPMAGGSGTGAMELYQGTVYGQDAGTGNWYTWNGTGFVGATSNPPVPSTTSTAFAALPAGFSVTSTTFSFTNPGLAAGSHTVTVRDANNTGVTVATGSFTVSGVTVTPVITPAAPSFPAVGDPFTLSGTLANYAAAPSLTFADNTGPATPLPAGGAGGLQITAQSVAASGKSNPLGLSWNSGCITSCLEPNGVPTAGLFARQYGYFEISTQLPKGGPSTTGPGWWPAFVLYPIPNSTTGSTGGPGEIDIFEILGGSTTVVRQSIHNGQGTSAEHDYTLPNGGDTSVGFHRIGCDWQSNTITFYVDGVQASQQATTSDMQENQWYMNLPFSVGGPSSWPGAPSPSAASTSGSWQIKYVGVWASHAAAYPSGDSATATPVTSAALFLDNFKTLDISWSGSSTQWLDHFPFGGSEYTLTSTGELEYMCDIGTGNVSSTGYQPFSLLPSSISPTIVTATTFSFLHPALAAGTYTTTISDGTNSGTTVSYTVTAIAGGASPNRTTVTNTTTSFTDNASNRWSINTLGQVVVDGVADTGTSNVIELAWVNGVIWQENSSGTWYSKANATAPWSAGTSTSPLANLPTITITAFTSPAPNTAFTVTGVMTNYGALIPTLTYIDNSAAAVAFPSGSTVSSSAFSFLHPAMVSGNDTLTISDGTTTSPAFSYTVATPTGWTSLPATTNLSNTITGLSPNTAYDVQVYATNSVGQSATTPLITVTTAAVAVVAPGVPSGLTSTAVGQTTVTLSWTAPTTGTPPFTYATQSSPHGANTWTAGPTGSSTSGQVTGLTANSGYDFEVNAANSAGTSAFSAIYTVSTVATPPTNASRVNDFLATIGINGQIQSYGSGAAYTNATGIVADAQYIGARLWRDGLAATTSGAQLTALTALANAGIRFSLLPTNGGSNPYSPVISSLITQATTAHGLATNCVAYLEGPNEPYNFGVTYGGGTGGGGASYFPVVTNFQAAYYAAIKANGTLGSLPVTSVTGTGDAPDNSGLQFATVPVGGGGTESSGGKVYFDVFNSHVYPQSNGAVGFVDPNSAVLSTPDGNADQFTELMTQDFGTPMLHGYTGNSSTTLAAASRIISEMGLSINQQAMSQRVQGVNTVNGYLDAYMDGYLACFAYELYDEGDGFGFATTTGTWRLVGNYMHNLITALADTGPTAATFTLGSLNYTLSGMPATAKSRLWQGSEGIFRLAIWNNTTNWSATGHTLISITPTTVTITLASGTATFTAFDITASGVTPYSTVSSATSTTIPLADSAFVVTINASTTGPVTTISWDSKTISGPLALTNTNLTATADGHAVLSPSNGFFLDGSSNVWSINPINNGTIYKNGSAAGSNFNVAQVQIIGTTLWQENTGGSWYTWDGTSNWNSQTTGLPTPVTAAQLLQSVLSTTAVNTGNVSFEVTFTSITQNCAVALVTAAHLATSILGSDANSVAFYPATGTGSHPAQTMWRNGTQILTPSGNAPASDVAGATLTFCVNFTSALWWVTGPAMQTAYGAAAWNCSATASPATGAGGISFSSITGAFYVAVGMQESGGVAVFNGGSSAFVRAGAIPSTFPPWNGGTVVVVIPGQVTGLTAGTVGSTTVALSWTAPSTGTLPLTYLVMQSPHSAGTYTQVATSATTAVTVSGLSASTAYDFEIIASNSAGNGTASAVLTVSTIAPVTLPGAPSGLLAGTATSSTVPLSWQAPTAGSPATGYQVQEKLSTAGSYTNFSPTATTTSQTVTGLVSSSTYNFQVAGINSAGTGPYSSPPVVKATVASTGLSPPAPAQAAGMTKLAYNTDFEVTGQIGPGTTGGGSGGFPWYLWSQCNATLAENPSGASSANAIVRTTQTAAGVSNGNNGGGSFASPAGGILTLNGPACNSGNITLTSGSNAFQGGYFECYAQCQWNVTQSGNWYAMPWMSALNRINGQYTEVDVNEIYCGNYNYPNSTSNASLKEWTPSGDQNTAAGTYLSTNSPPTNFINDNNWHKWAFFWNSNGPNKNGTCGFYLDDNLMYTWNGGSPVQTYTTGAGGSVGARFLETSPQQWYLGGPHGTNFDLNIDYFRVWRNPNWTF